MTFLVGHQSIATMNDSFNTAMDVAEQRANRARREAAKAIRRDVRRVANPSPQAK